MDVNSLIDGGTNGDASQNSMNGTLGRYPTRHSASAVEMGPNLNSHNGQMYDKKLPGLMQLDIPQLAHELNPQRPQQASQSSGTASKAVRFIYLLDDRERGRLSLPARIRHHDDTASIIHSVRNFFGLFNGRLAFEDESGYNIIPSFENFKDGCTIYLRSGSEVVEPARQLSLEPANQSPTKTFPMAPPASNQPLSRPGSRLPAPVQLAPGFEYSPQVSPTKAAPFESSEYAEDHSGTDEWLMRLPNGTIDETANAAGSKIASAEISEANIVDGGRRKRAKFDTQDLPLFQPMQVPSALSMNSASPVRRPLPQGAQSDGYALSHTDTTPNRITSQRGFYYNGPNRRRGVWPTPDHTTASAMSDEDVAWQLVNLSDYGRHSTHGRTSTSTVDDAYSGKAVASDAEESYSSEEDEEDNNASFTIYQDDATHTNGKAQNDDSSAEEYDDHDDSLFKGASSEVSAHDRRKSSKVSTKSIKSHKASKTSQSSKSSKKDTSGKAPPSPKSLTASSRKPSNASLGFTTPLTPLAPDETDLSSKPRCQRCRKSKKGCDRQRPCGRCKDAGLGADDCVSEEETNNKKGRYGRHMGVAIKKDAAAAAAAITHQTLLPPNPYDHKLSDELFTAQQQLQQGMDGFKFGQTEKNKKRKR